MFQDREVRRSLEADHVFQKHKLWLKFLNPVENREDHARARIARLS
jgi:hypothetical protein